MQIPIELQVYTQNVVDTKPSKQILGSRKKRENQQGHCGRHDLLTIVDSFTIVNYYKHRELPSCNYCYEFCFGTSQIKVFSETLHQKWRGRTWMIGGNPLESAGFLPWNWYITYFCAVPFIRGCGAETLDISWLYKHPSGFVRWKIHHLSVFLCHQNPWRKCNLTQTKSSATMSQALENTLWNTLQILVASLALHKPLPCWSR